MRRGDIVTVAAQGDHGKPRPALIIQTDLARETPLVLVLPLTSAGDAVKLARIPIQPNAETGLTTQSFAMLDRMISIQRDKVGPVIGHVDTATMTEISRALAVFVGLA